MNHGLILLLMAVLISTLALAACAGDDDGDEATAPGATDELKAAVIDNYAAGAHASYVRSLNSAITMDSAIDNFLAAPSLVRLDAAKRAWLYARDDYGVTEIYRFYNGPIDNEEGGPEALINAWPLDESYIDYVEGNPNAGVINNPDEYPTIDADLLISINEDGAEENVSTGWHAIEFLLWGQDMNPDGPGFRPLEDYTTNSNADRRATYLATASDVLIGHLRDMVEAWAPGQSNFRGQFVSKDADSALTDIITGIGEMSRGELAGERMVVAYEERSQEDEHSCFSDNTNADIVANAVGIQRVYSGNYGDVSGAGIKDLVAAEDPQLAASLEAEINASVALAKAIPNPFDDLLEQGVSDTSPGRQAVLQTIRSLQNQTDTIVSAAQKVGITISVS